MKTTDKLNPSIRALFKAKAKEVIEKSGHPLAEKLEKANAEMEKQMRSDPAVVSVSQKYSETLKAHNAVLAELTALALVVSDGQICFANPGYHRNNNLRGRFASQSKAYYKNRADAAEATACKCAKSEDPRVLEFCAELSLVKTVADAEALLAKLKAKTK